MNTETQAGQARPISSTELVECFRQLRGFINPAQLAYLRELTARGEEREAFRDKIREMALRVCLMPQTHDTNGQGAAATAYLHYFTPSADFYIIEKDMGCATDAPEDFQSQAFGLADLGYGSELGYISLPEILSCGAELDLYFNPQTVAQIQGKEVQS